MHRGIPCGTQGEARERGLRRKEPCTTLVSDLQPPASRPRRNLFLLCEPPSLWCSAPAAQQILQVSSLIFPPGRHFHESILAAPACNHVPLDWEHGPHQQGSHRRLPTAILGEGGAPRPALGLRTWCCDAGSALTKPHSQGRKSPSPWPRQQA